MNQYEEIARKNHALHQQLLNFRKENDRLQIENKSLLGQVSILRQKEHTIDELKKKLQTIKDQHCDEVEVIIEDNEKLVVERDTLITQNKELFHVYHRNESNLNAKLHATMSERDQIVKKWNRTKQRLEHLGKNLRKIPTFIFSNLSLPSPSSDTNESASASVIQYNNSPDDSHNSYDSFKQMEKNESSNSEPNLYTNDFGGSQHDHHEHDGEVSNESLGDTIKEIEYQVQKILEGATANTNALVERASLKNKLQNLEHIFQDKSEEMERCVMHKDLDLKHAMNHSNQLHTQFHGIQKQQTITSSEKKNGINLEFFDTDIESKAKRIEELEKKISHLRISLSTSKGKFTENARPTYRKCHTKIKTSQKQFDYNNTESVNDIVTNAGCILLLQKEKEDIQEGLEETANTLLVRLIEREKTFEVTHTETEKILKNKDNELSNKDKKYLQLSSQYNAVLEKNSFLGDKMTHLQSVLRDTQGKLGEFQKNSVDNNKLLNQERCSTEVVRLKSALSDSERRLEELQKSYDDCHKRCAVEIESNKNYQIHLAVSKTSEKNRTNDLMRCNNDLKTERERFISSENANGKLQHLVKKRNTTILQMECEIQKYEQRLAKLTLTHQVATRELSKEKNILQHSLIKMTERLEMTRNKKFGSMDKKDIKRKRTNENYMQLQNLCTKISDDQERCVTTRLTPALNNSEKRMDEFQSLNFKCNKIHARDKEILLETSKFTRKQQCNNDLKSKNSELVSSKNTNEKHHNIVEKQKTTMLQVAKDLHKIFTNYKEELAVLSETHQCVIGEISQEQKFKEDHWTKLENAMVKTDKRMKKTHIELNEKTQQCIYLLTEHIRILKEKEMLNPDVTYLQLALSNSKERLEKLQYSFNDCKENLAETIQFNKQIQVQLEASTALEKQLENHLMQCNNDLKTKSERLVASEIANENLQHVHEQHNEKMLQFEKEIQSKLTTCQQELLASAEVHQREIQQKIEERLIIQDKMAVAEKKLEELKTKSDERKDTKLRELKEIKEESTKLRSENAKILKDRENYDGEQSALFDPEGMLGKLCTSYADYNTIFDDTFQTNRDKQISSKAPTCSIEQPANDPAIQCNIDLNLKSEKLVAPGMDNEKLKQIIEEQRMQIIKIEERTQTKLEKYEQKFAVITETDRYTDAALSKERDMVRNDIILLKKKLKKVKAEFDMRIAKKQQELDKANEKCMQLLLNYTKILEDLDFCTTEITYLKSNFRGSEERIIKLQNSYVKCNGKLTEAMETIENSKKELEACNTLEKQFTNDLAICKNVLISKDKSLIILESTKEELHHVVEQKKSKLSQIEQDFQKIMATSKQKFVTLIEAQLCSIGETPKNQDIMQEKLIAMTKEVRKIKVENHERINTKHKKMNKTNEQLMQLWSQYAKTLQEQKKHCTKNNYLQSVISELKITTKNIQTSYSECDRQLVKAIQSTRNKEIQQKASTNLEKQLDNDLSRCNNDIKLKNEKLINLEIANQELKQNIGKVCSKTTHIKEDLQQKIEYSKQELAAFSKSLQREFKKISEKQKVASYEWIKPKTKEKEIKNEKQILMKNQRTSIQFQLHRFKAIQEQEATRIDNLDLSEKMNKELRLIIGQQNAKISAIEEEMRTKLEETKIEIVTSNETHRREIAEISKERETVEDRLVFMSEDFKSRSAEEEEKMTEKEKELNNINKERIQFQSVHDKILENVNCYGAEIARLQSVLRDSQGKKEKLQVSNDDFNEKLLEASESIKNHQVQLEASKTSEKRLMKDLEVCQNNLQSKSEELLTMGNEIINSKNFIEQHNAKLLEIEKETQIRLKDSEEEFSASSETYRLQIAEISQERNIIREKLIAMRQNQANNKIKKEKEILAKQEELNQSIQKYLQLESQYNATIENQKSSIAKIGRHENMLQETEGRVEKFKISYEDCNDRLVEVIKSNEDNLVQHESNKRYMKESEIEIKNWKEKCFRLSGFISKLTLKCEEWEACYTQQSKLLGQLHHKHFRTREKASQLASKYLKLTRDAQVKARVNTEENKLLTHELLNWKEASTQIQNK